MKYRLPGIYLGNISLDLLMQYMSDEDLSNQITSNDYYQTPDRTENIKVFRVDFSYDTVDYNFYTYNIQDLVSVREMIRTYFTDIIIDDADPLFDYDATVDALVFTVTANTYPDPILFDTLGQPSIYGTYMINDIAEHKYMISVKNPAGDDLNSYTAIKQYIEDPLTTQPAEVKVYDLRYAVETLIKTLHVENDTLKQDSVTLLEYLPDVITPTSVKENKLYFPVRSMLNLIQDSMFYYKDRFGGLSQIPTTTVMMQDIENNRALLDNSVKMKMLKAEYTSYFRGRAGIVRSKADVNSKVNLTFSKYDQYNINKNYEIVTDLTENIEVRFEDIEPTMINSITAAAPSNYSYDDSRMVVYTDLINTAILPKFKAIYKYVDGVGRYYIFDTIRGEVPEFRDGVGETSDDKTLCLLDVYDKNSIFVKTSRGNKAHSLIYNINADKYIFRTINVLVGGVTKTYYIKLANNENDLTGYIIVPSKTTDTFEDPQSLINDFPFVELGMEVITDYVYGTSYVSDGLGGTVVENWAMDIQMGQNEKLTVDFKTYDPTTDLESFSTFMDVSTLTGKLYFKMPIRLDITSTPTELTKDVLVTLIAKKLISANEYQFETNGYWATTAIGSDYLVEPPIFSEYNVEESKPFANISEYITLNNFDDTTYTKEYYLVNQYDQSIMYKVIETITHDESVDNPSPYNNTFTRLTNKLSSIINNNTISKFVTAVSPSITVDDRGELIASDLMGGDLIDSTKSEFKKGFNNIFYGIGNYTYNYTIEDSANLDKLDFLKNSLFVFDSLNKLLNKFLRYNFVSINNYLYTIDNSFRLGFFVKKDAEVNVNNKIFTNWMSIVPESDTDPNKLNAIQKIRNYEKTASDNDIENKARLDWVKNNMLYNSGNTSSTDYVLRKNKPIALKDINNKEMIDQAFSMLMDKRYNVTKVINSFMGTNVTQLVILDTKEKDLFSSSHDQVRFINSNQNLDVMIKSYLNGFSKKAGE